MILSKLADRYLPYPKPLDEGIRSGQVGISYSKDGSMIYVIAPTCRNKEAISQAIKRRNNWVIWTASLEGALFVFGAYIVIILLVNYWRN